MTLATVALALSLSSASSDQPPLAQPEPMSSESSAPEQQKADAQEPPTPEHTGVRALFHNLIEDITKLPALQNAAIAGIGGGLALGAHPWDQSVNASLQ